MARYIDADLLVEKLEQHFDVIRGEDGRLLYSDHICVGEDCDDLLELVNALPTADVKEVKWKAIDGYEGLYEVSSLGQVRNAKGQILKPILKPSRHTTYKKVSLWKNGKYKQLFVHRLVAKAFIPNDNNYPIINHKDEDGTNNLVENLEWCDRSYNATYGNAMKRLKKSLKGKTLSPELREKISDSMKTTRRKNTKLKFEFCGEMLSIPELAEKMGVKPNTLWVRHKRTGSVFLCNADMRGDTDV